jgi:hypothetical protein
MGQKHLWASRAVFYLSASWRAAFAPVQLNKFMHLPGPAAHRSTPPSLKWHEPFYHDGWFISIARGTKWSPDRTLETFSSFLPEKSKSTCERESARQLSGAHALIGMYLSWGGSVSSSKLLMCRWATSPTCAQVLYPRAVVNVLNCGGA